MKKSAYKELASLEKTYWWHVGRMNIIEHQLRLVAGDRTDLKILNIGSGTGGTIPTIEKFGEVTNLDTSNDAIKYLRCSGYDAVKFDGGKIPFKDRSFDLVVAFDVLEHVEDDAQVLEDWFRVVKKSGTLIVTVPAYQWLWSKHDEDNLHYRRYTKKSLKKTLDRLNSYKVSKFSYMIVFSLPLIVGFRLLEKGRKTTTRSNFVQPPALINKFFISLLGVEGHFHKYISFPAGTSLIIRIKKDQTLEP